MYRRRYAASLCHAWAGAAPVMAISRGILGVEPLEPGYSVCKIAPQRCGIAQVNGSVPALHGLIGISWNGSSGDLKIPAGVSAKLANGEVVKGGGQYAIALQ